MDLDVPLISTNDLTSEYAEVSIEKDEILSNLRTEEEYINNFNIIEVDSKNDPDYDFTIESDNSDTDSDGGVNNEVIGK